MKNSLNNHLVFRSHYGSTRYVIRKNGPVWAPWSFEGDAWGDAGVCLTFADAIEETMNTGWTPETDTRPYLGRDG